MPALDYNNPVNTGWMEDADTVIGIPIHPSGELSITDYYMAASGDLLEQRKRLTGMQVEVLVVIFLICLFSRNLIISSKMLIAKPHTLPSWCSFLSSSSGVIMVAIYLLMLLMGNLTCRIAVWGIDVGISASILFNNLILLHKAYLVLMRRKWILYVGFSLALPQAVYPFIIIYNSFIRIESELGCTANYPPFILWYWVAINIPLNVLFSAIFCHTTYKQYHQYGSDIWKRLTREGIQTMCLALLCNIICIIIVISHVDGANMDLFYIIDWAVVTTILANHCCRDRSRSTVDRHIKTSYIFNLSEIDTVK
ncbi:hypothetical protein BDF22DRAFT_744276 [Syncephalis plumigaleata]|nr:hypothetical protein BDF22DRAFT_744276 [Syncephalis plumigaleata]